MRKIWKYYDCVPTAVDTRTLTYADEGLDAFNVTFAYDNYNIQWNSLPYKFIPSTSISGLGIPGSGSVLGVGGVNGIGKLQTAQPVAPISTRVNPARNSALGERAREGLFGGDNRPI